MLRARQSGSRGTLTRSQGRASSTSPSSAASGSSRCSSTSQQRTSSAASCSAIEPCDRRGAVVDLQPGGAPARRRASSITSAERRCRASGGPAGEHQRELPLAAADLVRLARPGSGGELAQLGHEAADQAALDRVASRVLVVNVAARRHAAANDPTRGGRARPSYTRARGRVRRPSPLRRSPRRSASSSSSRPRPGSTSSSGSPRRSRRRSRWCSPSSSTSCSAHLGVSRASRRDSGASSLETAVTSLAFRALRVRRLPGSCTSGSTINYLIATGASVCISALGKFFVYREIVFNRARSRRRGLRPARRLEVRGLDAGLELEPAHPLEDPLGDHPLAGERVADDPERRTSAPRRPRSTAPRISDWTCPVESPLRIKSSTNGIHAATAPIANTSAAIVNTRSGS